MNIATSLLKMAELKSLENYQIQNIVSPKPFLFCYSKQCSCDTYGCYYENLATSLTFEKTFYEEKTKRLSNFKFSIYFFNYGFKRE